MSTGVQAGWTVLAAACVALLTADTVLAQATRYDPRLQFRTLSTPRFTIYYHQREEPLARRLASVAEEIAAEVDARLGRPRGRVHVILVDQSDQSNGWATVIPYNLIEIAAAPPLSSSVIGNTDDWLRIVFTHEYTHVVHLEKSGGWFGSLRHVFGRVPLFYPNLTLPDWQIEGIATRAESALTGAGRIHAGDFRMILDRAAAAGRFAPLDRAIGAVMDWPSGHTPYLYGGFFHEYLARTYGPASLERLANETASRLPWLGSPAFREVYGRSLGELWKEFEADLHAASPKGLHDNSPEPSAAVKPFRAASPTRLTHHGFSVTSPLFTRDGRLFYSISNPHGFPMLMELGSGGSSREVATRYGGNRLAEARGELVFDQLEVVAQVEPQSDLYAADRDRGDTRRLTRHARAADPDVGPDGETIVCTVQQTGRRILATLKMPPRGAIAVPEPWLSEDFTEFTAPRWSPDGRTIAVERRRLGGPSELVVIDVATRLARTVVSSTRGRNTLPAWMQDGRRILFSSDRDGGPFVLHAVDLANGGIRRLRAAGIGAQAPVFSPDGRRLVVVGYSADGYDLYELPLDGVTWEAVETVAPSSERPLLTTIAASPPTDGGAYRPWPTLAPRFWLPLVEAGGEEVVIGAATGASDALGRHVYAGAFGWNFDRDRPDVQFDYAYARWWPTVFASVASETDPWRAGEIRSHEVTAGALFPVRRVRWNSTVLTALYVSRDTVDCAACDEPILARSRRGALRAGWRISNAKTFGYSISAEEGTSVAVRTELTRRVLGADADASAVVADARHYLRVFPRHGVLAARVAGAASWGDERLRRVFAAGGSGPQVAGFAVDVDAIGLLRGFEESDQIGERAAVVNLDYRFPLAWVQRGIGTWPIFLRSIHGAVFADAGHAWDRRFDRSAVRRSVGGELSFDAAFGSSFGMTIATGLAWRRDRDGARDVVAFARIGRAF
jgi:hypothetical protein